MELFCIVRNNKGFIHVGRRNETLGIGMREGTPRHLGMPDLNSTSRFPSGRAHHALHIPSLPTFAHTRDYKLLISTGFLAFFYTWGTVSSFFIIVNTRDDMVYSI